MIILRIDISCDETGVALCSDFKILSRFTKTQSINQQYGGVVPEIATREHEKYLPSITKKVLEDANKSFKDIDAIAVTNGPGLMGSLLSGISFAKGISQALNIPIIPIIISVVMCFFCRVMDWCFLALGPRRNGYNLSCVLFPKIILATCTTKIIPRTIYIIVLVVVLFYFSSS